MLTYFYALLVIFPVLIFSYRRVSRVGTATSVDDGDGFTLKRKWLPALRVRIAWIDAPEKGQPYAESSRNALRSLLEDKTIKLSYVDKDTFGRQVAQVWVNGQDVGLKLVEQGSAWYYRHYASKVSVFRRWRYAGAERRARSAKRGLWIQNKPQAPWDFKHRPWWKKMLS